MVVFMDCDWWILIHLVCFLFFQGLLVVFEIMIDDSENRNRLGFELRVRLYFTLLFCKERLKNVPISKTHVQINCTAD